MSVVRLEDKLRTQLKYALIAKRQDANLETLMRCKTFKNILDSAQKSAKEKRIDEIDDSLIINAAKKEIKQLNELLEYCKDDADKAFEISVGIKTAEELLPKMVTQSEIEQFITDNKSEFTNIGAMMKALKAKYGDSLDSRLASQLVKTCL